MVLTGIGWVDGLLIASFVVGALALLGAKVLVPAGRWAQRIVHALDTAAEVMPVIPTLVTIATEFQPNGGHSLKDSLNRIERQLDTTIVAQQQQGAKLDTLHTYAHDARHEQANQIQKLVLAHEVAGRQLQHLRDKVDPIPAKLDAMVATAGAADAAAVEHRDAHPESPGE